MIYFAQHDKTLLIKIGFTINISDRLYNLRNVYGNIKLLGLLPGYQDTEWIIHQRFKTEKSAFPFDPPRNADGASEWFTPSKDLLSFVKRRTRLTLPLDLFADSMMNYGNTAYYPDGRKPYMVSKQNDMLAILECPPITEIIGKRDSNQCYGLSLVSSESTNKASAQRLKLSNESKSQKAIER